MRWILIIITITILGIYVMPGTVSLFAGQHYWYDIDAYGNDISCEKCHADIYEELKNSGHHSALYCEDCHRGMAVNYSSGYTDGVAYVSDRDAEYLSGWGAHAASPMACLYCHSGSGSSTLGRYHAHVEIQGGTCGRCHPGPPRWNPPPIAGGFGLTGNSADLGTHESHLPFVLESLNSSMLYHANEACIACHTQIELRFNYTSVTGAVVTVNNTHSATDSFWQFEGYTPLTTTYRITTADRTVKGAYGVIG